MRSLGVSNRFCFCHGHDDWLLWLYWSTVFDKHEREDRIGAEAVQTFPAKSPFYANPNPMKIYLGFSLRFEPRDTLPHGGNSIVVTCIQKGMSIKQEGSTV
jgi:hypothetical protein